MSPLEAKESSFPQVSSYLLIPPANLVASALILELVDPAAAAIGIPPILVVLVPSRLPAALFLAIAD